MRPGSRRAVPVTRIVSRRFLALLSSWRGTANRLAIRASNGFAAPHKDKPAHAGQWRSSRLIAKQIRFEHWLDGRLGATGNCLNAELIQSKTRHGTTAVQFERERRESPLILEAECGIAWHCNLKVRRLP